MAADSAGIVVRDLRSGSTAERAGLRDGDRIASINGEALGGASSISQLRRRLRGGDRVRFELESRGQSHAIILTLPALAEERLPGCEAIYGFARTPSGVRVRTVLTRPLGMRGPLPVVVFIPWLSCDPVEGAVPGDGWLQLLRAVAVRSGWAMLRIEKPGVGDSDGPDCAHNDLEADLAAFRAALSDLAQRPDVDREHVVLFGGSIGGGLVPILAQEFKPAGIIAAGGFSRTWLEHMLEIERRRLTLASATPSRVNVAMRGFADFYSLYLNHGMTPAQVLAKRPDLAPLWYDAPEGQYGRPAAYYQQVQALDVEDAWSRVDVPVLVIRGEFDWIMSRAEADHVIEIVGARHPGRGTLAVVPKMDHNFDIYATAEAAFRGEGGRFASQSVPIILDWLRTRFPAVEPQRR